MKLSTLLFEDLWDNDSLALFQRRDAHEAVFILYNPQVVASSYIKGMAAYVELRSPTDPNHSCAGAWQVAYSARNPAYRGSGQFLYALASSVVGAPITSDRRGSSSRSAKDAWKRIAANPAFSKTELDNFASLNGTADRFYVDTDAWQWTDGPKTPDTSDDCKLAGGDVYAKSPDELSLMQSKLGSPDAYKSSVDPEPFLKRHEEYMSKLTTKEQRAFAVNLQDAANKWFANLYQ